MPPEHPPVKRPLRPVPPPVIDADLRPERQRPEHERPEAESPEAESPGRACPDAKKVEPDQASVDHDFVALVRRGALDRSGPDDLGSAAWPARTSWARLSDVAGLGAVKRQLVRRVRRILLDQHSRTPAGQHLLFYGPPGCGKSLLARAVAGQLGAGFTYVDAVTLSRIAPEDWSRPGGLFEPASSPALRVIFIDSLETLSPTQAAALATAISTPTDNCPPALVLAATERLGDVASVLRTRTTFAEPIFVGAPRRAARTRIFTEHLQGRAGGTVSMRQLAACTPGLTGADIASICRRAADRVSAETPAGERPRPIEMIDLVVQNAVTPRILTEWRREQLGLRQRRR